MSGLENGSAPVFVAEDVKRRPIRWFALLFLAALGVQEVASRVLARSAHPVTSVAAESVPVAPALSKGSGEALLMPVAGVERTSLRDGWNDQRSGHTHHAIDIMAPRGSEVLAVADGRVVKLYQSGAGGRTIYLADAAGHRQYYYAHLDSYAPHLSEGVTVHRGEVIGTVGSSGNASPSAPHLHFTIEEVPTGGEWWKGEAVNPYPELMGH